MLEIALLLPVLVFLLFAIIEGSLLLFTAESAGFAAGDGARQASQSGNASNADSLALQVVRNTALGTNGLAVVSRIDIYKAIQAADGSLTADASHYNKYKLDGTTLQSTWPSSSRSVQAGQSDFLGLTIYYQYNWKTGFLLSTSPLQLSQTAYIRLEPQTY